MSFLCLEDRICIRGIDILRGLDLEEVFLVKMEILGGLSGKMMASIGTQRQKERE